jgi:hypothetical protein
VSPPATPQRRPGRLRQAVFALVVVVVFLVGANLLVERLERGGVVATHRAGDRVQYVEEALFEHDGQGRWRTTAYAEESGMLRQEFRRDKGDAFRVFVLGGSFAMGSPYVLQGYPDRGGGIPGFLGTALTQANPGRTVEVVNVAAGGQNSHRVMTIAEQVLDLEPDVLLVATCNNEGEPPPGRMRVWLHQQGGYRLLRAIVLRARPEEGSWYTPQDPDTEALRAGFRDRLRSMLDGASAKGVPVLLATLPTNLRYRGFDTGNHFVGDPGEPRPMIAPAERPALPAPPGFEDLPSCVTGVSLFEAEAFEQALPLLRRCLVDGGPAGRHAPMLPAYAALAELELGLDDEQSRRVLVDTFGACTAAGIELARQGRHSDAIDALGACGDPAEVLPWMGRSHLALGDVEAARVHLQLGVELAPRNRCRPSFNAIIREQSDAAPGTRLVDLEAHAVALSPSGLPGPELFLDYCHMSWWGYAAMTEPILEALGEVAPALRTDHPDLVELGPRLGLPVGDNAEQVRVASEWTSGPAIAPR